MVMHFTQCCCGCSLKTGSVIIGILFAVSSLCILIPCIVEADNLRQVAEVTSDVTSFVRDSEGIVEFTNNLVQGIEIFFIIYAAISAFQLASSIMVIFGASSEKPGLLKPWVVIQIINACLTGITDVVLVAMVFAVGKIAIGFSLLFAFTFIMCIWVYFILVVNSLHTEFISQQLRNRM